MLRSKRLRKSSTLSLSRRLTARWRVLPNFLIIGCQRCGTTSLYRYLIQHPLIAPTLWKEIHYFDRTDNFEQGRDWYRAHFVTRHRLGALSRLHHGRAITLEATPDYIFRAAAINRLADLLPDAPLIVLLRDPVDRAYSSYQNYVHKGRESRSFKQAIDDELRWIEQNAVTGTVRRSDGSTSKSPYFSRGVYVDQFRRLFARFSREQILVRRSEDMFANPQRICDDVFDFLGLPPHVIRDAEPANRLRYTPMDAALRQRLNALYAPYTQQLEALLGRAFEWSVDAA